MAGLHLGDLEITSPAFAHGERIPDRHTVNGEDVSPELSWTGAPEGTVQYALICHDPDAPLTDGFTHWVVYGIPADVTSLPEGANDYIQGSTDFGREGYGGPAPPPGHGTHHYFFHLYALSGEVDAAPGLSRSELLEKIDPLILVQARIVGTYSR